MFQKYGKFGKLQLSFLGHLALQKSEHEKIFQLLD